MKAASYLRYFWIGCLACSFLLVASNQLLADPNNGGASKTEATTAKPDSVFQGEAPSQKKKANAAQTTSATTKLKKTETKPALQQNEGEDSSFFSFSFLYYLFYKFNLSEVTDSAIRASWNSLISTFLG